jgi:predicted solute-binding protein
MKPDRKRAYNYENKAKKYNIQKTEEKIGIYQHIIQTYFSELPYSILLPLIENLDNEYDTKAMTYGRQGQCFIEVQFYPIH